MTEAQLERERVLESEALLASQGAWTTAAVAQHAAAEGADRPEQAWILSPFDTWEPNPHYTGPAVEHPEAGDYGPLENPEAEDAGDHCDDGQGPREDFSLGSTECDDTIPF